MLLILIISAIDIVTELGMLIMLVVRYTTQYNIKFKCHIKTTYVHWHWDYPTIYIMSAVCLVHLDHYQGFQ